MGFFDKWKNKTRGSLVENTIMLAIMEFSTLALGLVVSGYQYRMLGNDSASFLIFVNYVMTFVQLVIDFGFIQSAPGKISRRQQDKAFLSKMMTCVTVIKLLFFAVSCVVLFVTLSFTDISGLHYLTYWLCLFQVVTNSLMPDYMYRGLEKMSVITVRAVLIKTFSVVMILLFVRGQDHFYMVPLFTTIANIGAIIFVYFHLLVKMKIPFCRVSMAEIWAEVKDSAKFFLSRIASTTYSNVNGIIIGNYDMSQTAAYGNAEKIITAAKKGLLSPIADSMYPHMTRTRNFSIVKKSLKITMPILILGCAGVFILAEPICTIWLGPEGVNAVLPLRALMPTVIIALPSYILGFPTLGAMGLLNKVNNSTIFGTIIHILMLGIAFITGNLNMLTLCILTCITEMFILIYRILMVYRNRHLMYEKAPNSKPGAGDQEQAIELVADKIADEESKP